MQRLAVEEDDSSRAPQAWEAVIAARALVLDEMVRRGRTARDSEDPELSELVAQYQAASNRFANLAFRSFPGGAAQRDERLQAASRDKEAAERRLAAKSQEFRDWQARRHLGLNDITSSLPAQSALLSYSVYRRPHAGPFATPVRELVAFVATPDAPVRLVPLGPMQHVDSLVALWSFEAAVGVGVAGRSESEGELAYRRAGDALRRAMWDPVLPYLESARYVFVVPDGALHWVDMAALPRGAPERPRDGYLADDDRWVHLLAAERDLIPHRTVTKGRGLLALGGADFDRATSLSEAKTPTPLKSWDRSQEIDIALVRRGGEVPCDDLESLHFAPLPATSQEVRDVAALWEDSEGVQVLTGAAASDVAFKSMAPGKRVLHLATHGFFLDGSCSAVGADRRGIQLRRRPAESAERPTPAIVLRAGLALAGANVRDAMLRSGEDGILTAEEIAALDLQGVEWAVLSACNSGLGEVHLGEGVLGLRRAFQVAGVGSVIMSLWPVADQPTREWMRALYEGHLRQGLGTAEAVHYAHRRSLAARRARGASTHPFYWAGFVSTGNWR
jgi:CHAT domain-containing protein